MAFGGFWGRDLDGNGDGWGRVRLCLWDIQGNSGCARACAWSRNGESKLLYEIHGSVNCMGDYRSPSSTPFRHEMTWTEPLKIHKRALRLPYITDMLSGIDT